MEPGVSGATWLGTPPGKENRRNSSPIPVRSCGTPGRAAVAGADDQEHVLVALADGPVQVSPDEVQARGGAPVAEKPRLDVLRFQRLGQQRVCEQVDLAGRQVVGGT